MADNIIIVDDDPAVLDALTLSFVGEGFGVRAFSSAEALLAEADIPTVSCLVIDYRLPGMDGLALLGQLRQRGVNPPAILITTATPRAVEAAAAAKVVLVDKPLDGQLAAKVRELLV